MNVARVKRRWLRWCRYVDKTQTRADRSRGWGTDIHTGQSKAYDGVTYAKRYVPIGLRVVWYPRWANPR
jgi:hypothetical protein